MAWKMAWEMLWEMAAGNGSENTVGNGLGNVLGEIWEWTLGNGFRNDAVFFTKHIVEDDILFTNHPRASMCNSYTFQYFTLGPFLRLENC